MGLFDDQFKDFSEWKWRYYTSEEDTLIKEFVNKYPNAEFYIGTDSQKNPSKKRKGPRFWKFTTCLVAYTRRKGGNAIISSEVMQVPDMLKGKLTNEQRRPVLRQRLLYEATRSIQTGWYLNELIGETQPITIHLDVNCNLKWDSARYKDELVGYVTAQGFECEHKPNAWAATWAADNKC